MVTMHIKNKFEVSMRELVDQAEKKGGRPKIMVIDPMEAWELLNEMRHSTRSESPFRIKMKDGDQISIDRELWGKNEDVARVRANVLVQNWLDDKFIVEYNGIPIRVKIPPKQPEETKELDRPKPEGPPNEKISPKWWKFWKK